MPNYILIYKGEATDMADMTPEEGAAVLAKWQSWMEKVGPALQDVGSPFGPGASVIDDGSTGAPESLTGYSIIAANDLDQAQQLTDGHPYLSEGLGNYAVEVFELMPVPFED